MEVDDRYQNQHYVSQVLLRRFTDDSGFVQRFCLKTNKWKAKHPRRIFSRIGYTQILVDGTPENSLEQNFQILESSLPDVLDALDAAAKGGEKRLPEKIYNNLTWYCVFLWELSPFAKAASPLHYVLQLDSDLRHGRTDLLKMIGIPETNFPQILELHSKGAKFILDGEDYLQTMFRIMFEKKRDWEFRFLRYYVKWTLCHSPVEVPIADVAFLKFHDITNNAVTHLLPIGPKLVLVGNPELVDEKQPDTDTKIDVGTLTDSYAQQLIQSICVSAITAVACRDRSIDVTAMRNGAKGKTDFCKIKNLDAVFTAGVKQLKGDLRIIPVGNLAYRDFCRSFFEPYNLSQV